MTDISDAWKLCDDLSVVQAALLIAGYDPSAFSGDDWRLLEQAVPHFLAVKTALMSAIEKRENFGSLAYYGDDFEGRQIDLHGSIIRVEALKDFLSEKGVRDGFFFPYDTNQAEYLDPEHPQYAPKLAAAVRAWEAVQDQSRRKNQTPKQALEKWLRENAADYGLTFPEDGKVNESAIEAIARICNWQPQGGAPSTHSVEEETPPQRKSAKIKLVTPGSAKPEGLEF